MRFFYKAMHPKDADVLANSVVPDQTAVYGTFALKWGRLLALIKFCFYAGAYTYAFVLASARKIKAARLQIKLTKMIS